MPKNLSSIFNLFFQTSTILNLCFPDSPAIPLRMGNSLSSLPTPGREAFCLPSSIQSRPGTSQHMLSASRALPSYGSGTCATIQALQAFWILRPRTVSTFEQCSMGLLFFSLFPGCFWRIQLVLLLHSYPTTNTILFCWLGFSLRLLLLGQLTGLALSCYFSGEL